MNIGLVGRCNAFCQLTETEETLKAVFRDYDKKEGGYSCGVGKTDCMILRFAEDIHGCYNRIDECSTLASQAMRPQKRFL